MSASSGDTRRLSPRTGGTGRRTDPTAVVAPTIPGRASGGVPVEEGPEGLRHLGGRLPAVARLLLQRLPQDPLEGLGGVGPMGPEGDRRVLEDDGVGVAALGIEVVVGVAHRHQEIERGGRAVDVGRSLTSRKSRMWSGEMKPTE